jgi:BACON domain-containing protein
METKRCPYCHKLQRAEAQTCSRCGRAFLNKKPETRTRDLRHTPIPPASPHRAGHYAGLHPEDQPYQSSKIAVQRPPFVQDNGWQRPLHEPEQIILPSPEDEETLPVVSRHVVNRQQEPFSPTPPQKRAHLVVRPISFILALSCLFFLLASSIIAFALIGKNVAISSADVSASPNMVRPNDAFTLSGQGFTSGHWLTFSYDFRHTVFDGNHRPLQIQVGEDGRFSTTIHVTTDWGFGRHAIYVLDSAQQSSISTNIVIEQASDSQPHLQIPATEVNFGQAEAGVISTKTLTLANNGGGMVQWQVSSDQDWLSVSPDKGTFAGSTNIQITVNRENLTPAPYLGHLTFKQNGENATTQTVLVTMEVEATPPTPTATSTAQANTGS